MSENTAKSDGLQYGSEAVRCCFCLAPQWPSNSDDPVRHCPGCETSELHYPLHELAKILSGLPPVMA